MNPENRNRLIIVLGMHRSGTSAITKSLELLGVGLGSDMVPAGLDNPKGFWEDRECVAINDTLLSYLGSAYDRLDLAWNDIQVNSQINELKSRATQLILRKLSENNGVWGFKDPRTCRLLAFWGEVFLGLDCDVSFVIAVRNPASVAASLANRNDIPEEKSYFLWLQHVLPPLSFMNDARRVVVDYDELLANPYLQIVRIARNLALPLPDRQSDQVMDYENNYLEKTLRHLHFCESDLTLDGRASKLVASVYGFLLRLARDQESLQNPLSKDIIEEFSAILRSFKPAFDYINVLEDERLTLNQALFGRDERIVEMLQEVDERNQQAIEYQKHIVNLENSIADRDEKIRAMLQEVDERDQQAIEYQKHIANLENSIADRDEKIRAMLQEVDERDQQAIEFQKHIANLENSIADRDEKIRAMLQEVDERNQQAIEYQKHIVNLENSIADRDEKIRAMLQEVDERDQQAIEYQKHIANLENSIADRDEKIRAMLQGVDERDQQAIEYQKHIANLENSIADHDEKIRAMLQEVDERDQQAAEHKNQFADFEKSIAERDEQIYWLNQAVRDARNELAKVLSSKSWWATKPLRFSRRVFISKPNAKFQSVASNSIHILWRALPLSFDVKQKVKGRVFRTLPWVFERSNAYKAWKSFSESASDLTDVGLTTEQQVIVNADDYVPLLNDRPLESKAAKLICFYLPQFHPIPENDEWWGEGFTEWTNVMPARPQFKGHYQPHVPGELGYYNLLDSEVQHRQVELAKLYGIEGFCFYFYWFGGKRLLETPIQNYLLDTSLDLPFCLCWANENWSRRWDGLDSEILIAQQHSTEDDLAFIQHVASYMRDSRYIRIGGKPLLLVYRPSLLPSAKETAARWRKWCRENGLGEIYLAYTQSFEAVDPANYGFDAAIEFPPNNSAPPNITDSVSPNGDDFGCTVYDWKIFVERSEAYKDSKYKLFRSVCPSWDNTARRKNRSTVFLNSTPALYQRWLENAIRDTEQQFSSWDERLIFINAWNEWAEGAHLEPDARYGYAYLQATRHALNGTEVGPIHEKRRIVLVAHDAYPHGAQLLALNLAKTLSQGMGFNVDLVCLGDGPLKSEYTKWATLHDLTGKDARGKEAVLLAKTLYDSGNRVALVNTTVSGYFLEALTSQGFECVALIHELRGVLDQLDLHKQAAAIAEHAKKIVFPAKEVAASFNDVALMSNNKVVIRPQGLYKRIRKSADRSAVRLRLRQMLGLPQDSQIILGVGYADYRKGIDLFVDAGLKLAKSDPLARWVWIGHWEQGMQRKIEKRLDQFPEIKDRFIFPGLQLDTDVFYEGSDVFALTSREDPFPSVVLEALDAGLPVIGFEDAGGFINLLSEGCGKLVAKENAEAFAEAVRIMIKAPNERELMGLRGAEIINERFSFRHYVFDLLDLLGIKMERVSVVVPNYNYAQYLPERLSSIVSQTYPIYEIIFLDDCSKDDSIKVAQTILESSGIDYRIVINDKNSGSVFRQWRKGVELARGSHVWIAEADDFCSKDFLHETMQGFKAHDVVISYCESKQVDDNGRILANNYLDYVSDIDERRWLNSYVRLGRDEARETLCIKNTIPNVSGVVFEKSRLKSVLDENIDLICSYRVAGDWLVYVLMLKSGNISFSHTPLNMHRRHGRGVTIGNFNECQLNEIKRMQLFVSEEFEIPQDKAVKADQYIEQLANQFGLIAH